MKRFLLLVVSVVMFGAANAQDVIVLQSAEEIQAKVEAITQNQVTYRRWSNLGGPTYTIDKSQIFYIKYQNGEKDVMTSMTPANRMTSVSRSATAQYSPITFAGYVNLGTIFNADGAGPTFDITAGMKVYDYFYAGIATGFHSVLTPYEYYYYYGSYYDYYDKGTLFEAYIPVGVNLKSYFTKGRKVNPYFDCTLGAFIGVGDLGGFNGFHCQVGMGLDIKRFTIGMGYNPLVKYGTAHFGYFKLGYRFGK